MFRYVPRLTAHRLLAATVVAALAITTAAVATGGGQALGLRPPRLGLIVDASPAIQIHLSCAVAAFLIGASLLLGVKGTLSHRVIGWAWAGLMAATAITSFFIHSINPGGFSPIHAISGWVIIALPAALYAARRHKVKVHRRGMLGLYFGGMLIAGSLALLPGRLLGQVFFS